MEPAATEHEPTVADLINLKAQSLPFMKYMFAENVIKGVQPVDWWVSRADCVHLDTVMLQNNCLPPQVHRLEWRVFSSFSLVHFRLRNRLGVAKAVRLVFLFNLLNRKTLDADEDYDLDQ